MEKVTYSPEQIIPALMNCVRTNTPFFIQGKPGGGKTSLIRDLHARVKASTMFGGEFGYIEAPNLAMSESVDWRGVPAVKARDGFDVTTWSRPDCLPRPERDGFNGFFVCDDANNNRALFGSLYEIVLERRCGEHAFPNDGKSYNGKSGWIPVLLGNYTTDKALSSALPSALNNRLAVFDYVSCPKFFGGPLAAKIGLHPLVAAYARFRADYLHLIPGEKPASDGAPRIPADARSFPSPRSWESVSHALKDMDSHMSPQERDELRQNIVASRVGPEAAADFESFVTVAKDAPQPADIIANPDSAKLPDSVGIAWAVVSALASLANPQNIDAIIRYGKRLEQAGFAEFYVVLGKDAAGRNPAIVNSSGFNLWARDNAAFSL